jgi:6-phosphogluconate dehydrogenase (decarboxylating)
MNRISADRYYEEGSVASTKSEIGMVGLGRMGANMAKRLMADGHRVVAFDVDPYAVKALAEEGADGASSLEELASKLSAPRAVWIMVPAGEITEKTVESVAGVLDQGDAIIDGGNSYYRDDIRRAARCFHFIERPQLLGVGFQLGADLSPIEIRMSIAMLLETLVQREEEFFTSSAR